MQSKSYELDLPEFFQLSCVEELHSTFSENLSNTVLVDGSSVTKIDTAALQLLLSLQKNLQQTAGQLQLINPSDAMVSAIQTLGLSTELLTEPH